MRKVTDHVANPVNDLINILVTDEPGAGGANHQYKVEFPDGKFDIEINFQKGPINEAGINGVTQEVLLAIVIDRLRSFQAGPFACNENQGALDCAEQALDWLKSRTKARMKRGVEGKSVA